LALLLFEHCGKIIHQLLRFAWFKKIAIIAMGFKCIQIVNPGYSRKFICFNWFGKTCFAVFQVQKCKLMK